MQKEINKQTKTQRIVWENDGAMIQKKMGLPKGRPGI